MEGRIMQQGIGDCTCESSFICTSAASADRRDPLLRRCISKSSSAEERISDSSQGE